MKQITKPQFNYLMYNTVCVEVETNHILKLENIVDGQLESFSESSQTYRENVIFEFDTTKGIYEIEFTYSESQPEFNVITETKFDGEFITLSDKQLEKLTEQLFSNIELIG